MLYLTPSHRKKLIVFTVFVLSGCFTYAQLPEFRITNEGQYEYLDNRSAAAMAFDETQGTYYKPITLRSFFLLAQRREIIQSDLAFDTFITLSTDEQRTLLNPTLNAPLDCSIGQVISEGCLVYKGGINGQKDGRSDVIPAKKNSGGKNTSKAIESAQIPPNEK